MSPANTRQFDADDCGSSRASSRIADWSVPRSGALRAPGGRGRPRSARDDARSGFVSSHLLPTIVVARDLATPPRW
jgi:hypothetical protein